MVDVGFKNFVTKKHISLLIKPYTIKAKWLIKEAKLNSKLIDCTQGKKIGVLILLNSRHLILSPLKHSSLSRKLSSNEDVGEIFENDFSAQEANLNL